MLTDLLAEDVTFSSPVADYHRRENGAHMLGLIVTVFDDVAPARRWGDERESLSAFTARVDDGELQGILREEHGPGWQARASDLVPAAVPGVAGGDRENAAAAG